MQNQAPDGRVEFRQVQIPDPGVAENREDVYVQAGSLFGE